VDIIHTRLVFKTPLSRLGAEVWLRNGFEKFGGATEICCREFRESVNEGALEGPSGRTFRKTARNLIQPTVNDMTDDSQEIAGFND